MKYVFFLLMMSILVLRMDAQTQPLTRNSTDTISYDSIVGDSVKLQIEEQKKLLASKMAEADLTYFIIRVPDNKFGYSIFIDGHMYIEQKSIPAISGNAGFSKVEDAEFVARLVISKIKVGEMPPTISIEELQELNIVY